MLVEGVHLHVGHGGHTALCKRGIRLVEGRLADHTNLTLVGLGHLQGVTHASYSGTDHEKVILISHIRYFGAKIRFFIHKGHKVHKKK